MDSLMLEKVINECELTFQKHGVVSIYFHKTQIQWNEILISELRKIGKYYVNNDLYGFMIVSLK